VIIKLKDKRSKDLISTERKCGFKKAAWEGDGVIKQKVGVQWAALGMISISY